MDDRNEAPHPAEEEGSLWLNIGKTAFLIGVLVAAWFLLDWLIGGK
jgi:hypothetical protein